ncbi:hypothetical protein DV515_00014439 [Chloebia gouldiae]|uniref:Uncharacterized protein n=1 Tax=Chloebia gouldiae TaxID=44316 RepID=A0A3L8RYB5_CHLGU|nr:hypothetical protein DV515_00014439 [Chloebia gouldiae]
MLLVVMGGMRPRSEETTFEAGVKVQIHSQSEPPFVQELGFGVAPGFQTFVATQEQRLTYLPPPWGECRSPELGLAFFPVYSVTACRIDCETRYIVENCNCRMVHMPGQGQGHLGTGWRDSRDRDTWARAGGTAGTGTAGTGTPGHGLEGWQGQGHLGTGWRSGTGDTMGHLGDRLEGQAMC